jgi:hypothetical protein
MESLHFKGKYDNRVKLFSFIASARMSEKEKQNLSQIFYDAKKKRIWATDGHRLHIAYIDMGENDRQFKVVSSKKNEIILIDIEKENFVNKPNIGIVLTNARIIAKQPLTITEKCPESAYVQLMRLFKKAIINQKFFNSLSIFSDFWTALIQNEETEAVYFKSENCLAVIMPLNM